MFAWYWCYKKQPRGGFVYQMCNVLHYRLIRSPASVQEKHISPVTLREKDGMPHQCENCGIKTTRQVKILVQQFDVYLEDGDKTCYVSFCSETCSRAHVTKFKTLVPGLELRKRDPVDPRFMVRMWWDNICVPDEGNPVHNMWRPQYVLQEVDGKWGITVFPCDWIGRHQTVKWDCQLCAPSIHVSLEELNERFPVPAH